MNDLQRLNAWVEQHRDWFFDAVRIYLGIGLFVKAIYFMQNQEYLASLLNGAGNLWLIPAFVVHYVMLAHLVGGLFLALGFLGWIVAQLAS